MTRLLLGVVASLAALAGAGAAGAVGLGPLQKSGITDGAAKAFYLTLFNPYAQRTAFVVYAVGADDEIAQLRVHVPGPITLPGQSSRRFMIFATGLAADETYSFRICAEKANDEQSEIHARVCSRVTARRVPAGV